MLLGASLEGEQTVLETRKQTMSLGIKVARVQTWEGAVKRDRPSRGNRKGSLSEFLASFLLFETTF